MLFKNKPIQNKLMTVILMTSVAVLVLTCTAFIFYEYYSSKKKLISETTILARMCAANTTAALAFENADDAKEVLSSLKVSPHIMSAVLFDARDSVFAYYPDSLSAPRFIDGLKEHGFRFDNTSLTGVIPVLHDGVKLGTLQIVSNLSPVNENLWLFLVIVQSVIISSLLAAYFISKVLQRNISRPILALAETTKEVSDKKDYALRAMVFDNDEVGDLTRGFNQMLSEIESQNQEILSLNQNLEEKVLERTKELEQAYNEMEAFSYTVSHDLNAPLRHIDTRIGLYLSKHKDNLDDESLKILETITRNTAKMRQLINDLLDFSKVARKELEKTEIAMTDLVSGIWQECAKLEENRLINVTIDPLANAHADEATIKQVWQNLISNALKYSTQKNPAVITITSEDRGQEIVYSVQDNGIGFDMKDYDKLFTAFQRLHSGSQFNGTGVGLAIVERIVLRHSGKVWAKSEDGQGAAFFFSLPKIPAENLISKTVNPANVT